MIICKIKLEAIKQIYNDLDPALKAIYVEDKKHKKEKKESSIVCKCPKCDGDIIEKPTRKGKIFWGCSNYPKCKYMKKR